MIGQSEVSWQGLLLFTFQMSLGIIFLFSVLSKLHGPYTFIQNVIAYKILSPGVAYLFGLALIPIEIFLTAAFLTNWLTNIALPLSLIMFVLFLIAVSINLHRGRQISCGCFGDTKEQISNRTLARLILLLIVVLLLLVLRNTTTIPSFALSLILFDNLMIIYLLQTIVLALFFILAGSWLLQLPELILLARYGYRHYFSPGNIES